MKYKVLKFYANFRALINETIKSSDFNAELRRKIINDMAEQLLNEPVSARFDMLKKINDKVHKTTLKQQIEFKKFIEEQEIIIKEYESFFK